MKQPVKVGTEAEVRFRVAPEHAIDFADQDLPAVLSTPWLIWFLEHAAREAVLPALEPEESTVGIHVDVKHLAATPLGHQVVCRARVIFSEGPEVSFQLEARDEHEVIARGNHRLHVIRKDRFARRVQKKQSK